MTRIYSNILSSFCIVIILMMNVGTTKAYAGIIYYKVKNVANNDVLNIRAYPSFQSKIIDMLAPDTHGITATGKKHGKWVQIISGNSQGWVDGNFLSLETYSDDQSAYSTSNNGTNNTSVTQEQTQQKQLIINVNPNITQ